MPLPLDASVDTDATGGGVEHDSGNAWLVALDPHDRDIVQLDVGVQDLLDRTAVAAQLDGLDPYVATPGAGMFGIGAVPVDEEGHLRCCHGVQYSELHPAQFDAVGSNPTSAGRRAPQSFLYRSDVVDGEHPAEPAAAVLSSLVDSTAEGCLLGGRVIECTHNLDVGAIRQRQDEIASSERWMPATVHEGPTEIGSDALDHIGDLRRSAGVGQMVEPHGGILPNGRGQARGGSDLWQAPAMSDAPQQSASAVAPSATLDMRKTIILGAIGIAFIVLIFWKVIPQIGSYSAALTALESMTWIAVALIVVTVIVYLAVYGLAYKAAEPTLTYWQSQQVNQAAFTISNGVPAGGAVGLAVQFGMLTSYRLAPTNATAAITAVSIWSTFISLGFPILGVLALSISGTGDSVAWLGPLGLGILTAIVVLFVLVMRSPALAQRIGDLGNAVVAPLKRRITKLKNLDLAGPIVKFRADMYDLLKRRWLWLTLAQVGISFTQFLILFAALRGVEGWSTNGTSPLDAFGAYAVSHIMLMVPITPGGLGTMDALMIQLLVSSGTEKGAATAADLVWRATSYFPQIIVGIIALVTWYRRAGQALATRSVGAKESEGTH